jgi:hypothetical protein
VTRVLVVSGGPTLASIAETGGYDVLEARLGDVRAWLSDGEPPSADIAMLDISDPTLAGDVAALLRARHPRTPQIVIRGTTDSLAPPSPAPDLVLIPPLGRDQVLRALTSVLDVAPAQSPEAAEDPTPAHVATPVEERPPDDRDPVPPLPPQVPKDRRRGAARPSTLAPEMAQVASDAPSVAEVAATLTQLATEELSAQAAVLLVPDGDGNWLVVGGIGIRPIERVIALPDHHWLVQHLILRHRAAAIDKTDVVRAELSNAPLAAWDCLLVVPNPAANAALMLARSSPAFDAADVQRANELLGQATPSIADGLALHRLARSLERFLPLR